MTSINKLIEIKYLNDGSSDFFDCVDNVKDFLADIKERFEINEKDLKEKKINFYIIKEKEKKQIDIIKDYNKNILNNDEMIINLQIENKNYTKNKNKKENENNNEIITKTENNNDIKTNNLLKSSIITKEQMKNILDKNNENLVSNFSNNLNNLNTKINSIEKQMIDINKNIQNVPNLINQTFSIQFPQIEQKISKKLINIQKIMIGFLKTNKNEINNILENFNSNLLNTSINMFNDKNNNNNYDILLEDHNKLKEELSNKNKIEADLKTKIKDLEKKIESNNLSLKNKENDYIKKMKDSINKNKILQENEKKLNKEIYLLKEKINKLCNSNNNFIYINNNDDKSSNKNNKTVKKKKKSDSENNSSESNNNSEDDKERVNSDESDNDSKENNDNNNKNKNNKNNNNKKFNKILNESIRYEYEFIPNEKTYSIEKSKLKNMNNKSVNFFINIKNLGKTPIPVNSIVKNENLVKNDLFKFYCRIDKEIKPNESKEFTGKIIVNYDNNDIKQNYMLILKLYNNFKNAYNDSKFVLNINILNEKTKTKTIIKELNNEQIKKIIDEINETFKDQNIPLNKLNLKQEIKNLMENENFQNFDSFDDLKEKIIEEISDKIYSS